MNRQKNKAHYAIRHDARAEFAGTLFVYTYHFTRGIFSALGPPQIVEIFFLRQSVDENRLNDIAKTDIVSSNPTNEPPAVNPSSIHAPRIVSIIYFSPTASFALKELYHTHNAAVKETPSVACCRRRCFCFAAQNKPQNMIEFSALLCYNIEDYTGIYCHYCFRSVFVADNC